MELLCADDVFSFIRDDTFHTPYLLPINIYVNEKIRNNWDDYNEFFHATSFLEKIQTQENADIDYHVMLETETQRICGIIICSTNIQDIALHFETLTNDDTANLSVVVSLDYFHITEIARGRGQAWLTNTVIPYYKRKGFETMYVKTTHDNAGKLYAKFGTKVGSYTKMSDNGKFTRNGQVFKIEM